MLIKNATVSIFLETRTPKKDDTFPVKLRITYNRIRKYYSLKSSLTQKQFDEVFSSKPKGKAQELKIEFNEIESKALEIIKQMPVFSFNLFEKELFTDIPTNDKNDVYDAYDNYIRQLKENEQFGTSETYENSKNSILKFSGRKKILFDEITPEFLTKYERWQFQKYTSPTTISIYLRCLRKLINSAIANDAIKQSQYPFGRNKYIIPASKNIKKALSIDELGQIYNYKPIGGSTEEFAKDIWMFSYMCNGMNLADIARLKYLHVNDSKIIFNREKTKNTSKHNSQAIIVTMLPDVIKIIEKWGTPNNHSNFIFPILNKEDEPEYQRKRIKQFTKTVNKYMKRIANNLEIDKPMTSYAARHSFSTIMKKSGAPIEVISESLGHSSINTTRAYLDSFDEGIKIEFMKNLTAFKKD